MIKLFLTFFSLLRLWFSISLIKWLTTENDCKGYRCWIVSMAPFNYNDQKFLSDIYNPHQHSWCTVNLWQFYHMSYICFIVLYHRCQPSKDLQYSWMVFSCAMLYLLSVNWQLNVCNITLGKEHVLFRFWTPFFNICYLFWHESLVNCLLGMLWGQFILLKVVSFCRQHLLPFLMIQQPRPLMYFSIRQMGQLTCKALL